MIKNIIIVLAISIVLGICVVGFNKMKSSSSETTTTTSPATTQKKYTATDIAAHKDATSCWSSINEKVYDLTSWIEKHPGGSEKILQICGKDGSEAFNEQHNGQRKPENELTNYLIGTLTIPSGS